MRTQSICLALAIFLVCPIASAQWVQRNGVSDRHVPHYPFMGTNVIQETSRGLLGLPIKYRTPAEFISRLASLRARHMQFPFSDWKIITNGIQRSPRPLRGVSLPESQVYVVDNASNHYIFGSGYNLTFIYKLIMTGIASEGGNVPATYSLSQNYPNPFNPSTTIKYELPGSSIARLSVYDLLGREVSVLVNERRGAGVHEVKFDGSGLSSGVYLFRLQAGSYVETKELVLVSDNRPEWKEPSSVREMRALFHGDPVPGTGHVDSAKSIRDQVQFWWIVKEMPL